MAECLWVRAEASKGDIAGNIVTEHLIRVRKWKKPSLGNLQKCSDQTLVLKDEGIRGNFLAWMLDGHTRSDTLLDLLLALKDKLLGDVGSRLNQSEE